MDSLPPEVQDTAVLRRIIFAVAHLPTNLPQYWSIVAQFGSSKKSLTSDSVKMAVENLQFFDQQTFTTDTKLQQELHDIHVSPRSTHPLGIPFVSKNTKCIDCGGELKIRSDRPSHVTVYTESWGTVAGTHYHKFCQNARKGCKFRQYYGYHVNGMFIHHYNYLFDPNVCFRL